MKKQTEINIDIVKITSSFIDSLPKSRQEFERENSSVAHARQRPVSQVNIKNMSDPLQKKLNEKIYEPYYISNSTILEY